MIRFSFLLIVLLSTSIACGASKPANPCDSIDRSNLEQSFVVVVEPAARFQAKTPLKVRGCSRTLGSQVAWELRADDGRVLVSGRTMGGAITLAEAFSFVADFDISTQQDAKLVVYVPDEWNGTGSPHGRSTIPLVLVPNPLL